MEKAGIKTLKAAKAKKREYENIKEEGNTPHYESKNLTLDEWYIMFVELKNYDLKGANYVNISSNYRNHLQKPYGSQKLTSLNNFEYQRFLNTKLKEAYKSGKKEKTYRLSTIKSIHKTFMTILNFAVKKKKLNENQLMDVEIQKEEEPVKRYIAPQDFKTTIQTSREKLHKQVLCMINLLSHGLRRGEVYGIRECDVQQLDSDSILLTIKKTRTQLSPSGKNTKTEGSERDLIIVGETAHLVLYAIELAKKLHHEEGQIFHQNNFIFINRKTLKPYHPSYLTTLLQRFPDVTVSPHRFRHTFATDAQAESPIRDVSEFLGHANIKTTQMYSHTTVHGAKKVAALTNKRLKSV